MRKSMRMSVLAVLGSAAVSAQAALTGGGVAGNPYLIGSYADLKEFAQVVNGGQSNAWAVVTDNITTSETDWTAIGTEYKDYQGTFDGAGHVMSGLANEGTPAYAGLFGKVGSGGVVRNVRLAEVSFRGKSAGGIAESNQGTVSNCCVSGSVQGESIYYAGGVVGGNQGTVANCYNTANVSIGDKAYVGGVVGYNFGGGTVTNCHSTGRVLSGDFKGGVVGYNDGTVANSYCLDDVGVAAVGGNGGTVEGGGELSATDYTNAARFNGWDFDHVWVMWKAGPVLRMEGLLGSGTEEDPYVMYDYATLVAFAEAVNGGQTNAWGVLAADIATTETNWMAIGDDYNRPYNGTFDGAGHAISGLANAGTPFSAGLFGWVYYGGVVRNVRLAGVAFHGEEAGGVAVCNNGTVSNCCVSGSVWGEVDAGGVVGENCGTVLNCYNTGTVSGGETAAVGGVVGRNYIGTVANCHSTGAVSGGSARGGVVGQNFNGTVSNSYCPFSLRVTAIGAGDNTGTVEECWPLSAAAYTQTNSFSGWDFANVWEMGPEAPVLRGVSRVYPLWVDGKQVWDGNEADILGDGSARYAGTAAGGTLALSNAVITNAVAYDGVVATAGIYAGNGFDLTVALAGSNRVENAGDAAGRGIRTKGNLSFGGEGSLTVKGGSGADGISADGTLRIDGTTVTSSGVTGFASGGNIVLSNAIVSATGSLYGIYAQGAAAFFGASRVEATASDAVAVLAGGGITVGEGLRLVEPGGGGLEANGQQWFVDAGGNDALYVRIEPLVAYDLWVGGVQVTEGNAGDILGDGSAWFEGTAAGGTLALSNAVVTNAVAFQSGTAWTAGIYAGNGFDLAISLKGSNRVDNAKEGGSGIRAKGNLSVVGEGTLTVESLDSGMEAGGNLRIEGATVAASGSYGLCSPRNIVLSNATVSATGANYGIYAHGTIAFAGESRVEATATNSNGKAVEADDGIALEDGLSVALPVGGRVSGTTITNAGGDTATNAIVAYFYDITVNEGSTTNSPSAAGFPVEIVANPPGDGRAFVQWSSNDGVEFVDAGAGTTWFTMPATNVTVTAVSAEIVITWEGETEYTYTGSAITPGFTVSLKDVDLHVGTNYVASWAGNTNAGTATVSVTLTTRPSGVQSNTFRIKPKALDDEMVQLTVPTAGWWTYDGTALQPGFSLSDGNPSALTTSDIVVSWIDNDAPGWATAVFTGTNNYTGRVAKPFLIVPAQLDFTVTAGKWGAVAVETNGVALATVGPDVTTNLVVAYGSSVTATAVPNAGYAVDGDVGSVSFASFTEAAEVAFAFQPVPDPELRWKYARNANGWYCAQVALTWHPGYEEALGSLRLLFADRKDGEGNLSAYLVDPATVLDPLGATEEYNGTTYRAAAIDLAPFASLAEGEKAVYGVSYATMTNGLSSVPKAERLICLRVVSRVLETVAPVDRMIACLAWETNGSTRYFPIAQAMTRSAAAVTSTHSSLLTRRSSFASRPISAAEANLASSFGLSAAAVARGRVVCRIAEIEIGADGAVAGTFAIGAEAAGGAVAESGELTDGVRFTVLGAAELDGDFAPLDAASCGVTLQSRTPPYAFRVEKPGEAQFFKVVLETDDVFE